LGTVQVMIQTDKGADAVAYWKTYLVYTHVWIQFAMVGVNFQTVFSPRSPLRTRHESWTRTINYNYTRDLNRREESDHNGKRA
jgi:hypothetical protein